MKIAEEENILQANSQISEHYKYENYINKNYYDNISINKQSVINQNIHFRTAISLDKTNINKTCKKTFEVKNKSIFIIIEFNTLDIYFNFLLINLVLFNKARSYPL